MPRRTIDPSDRDKLTHYQPVLFSTNDIELIERVRKEYGISRGAAVRLMMRHGAKRYDPYSTEEEGE